MDFALPKSSDEQPTLDEWFKLPPIQVLTTSAALGWTGVSAQSANIHPTVGEVVNPLNHDESLVYLQKGMNRIQGLFADGKFFEHRVTQGTLITVPRHAHFTSRWFNHSTAAFIQVSRSIIHEIADAVSHGDPEHIEILPLRTFHDPLLGELCMALVAQTQNQNLMGHLYAESIAQTMAFHLLLHYSTAPNLRLIRTQTFTPIQQHRVIEYIDAHLHLKISVQELAQCLNISVPHFEKLFRATFHDAPYQYVIKQKIERAKQLLKDERLSILEVVYRCGFANQSHFTHHFTKLVGVSPAKYAYEYRTHQNTLKNRLNP